MRITTFWLLALALAFPATEASGQPATAQAEILFREGKRLIQEGNIAAACEAFEGSYKRDSVPSTLMNLADCREKNQQYASAWAHFVETARVSRLQPSLAELARVAQQRAAAVEKRLSYLIVNVPDEARVEGLVITRNGAVVEAVEWNRDIPVDGGSYTIEAKAPAYEAWSTKVTVDNASDKQSVNVPRFRQAAGNPARAAPREATPSTLSGRRRVTLVIGALGIAALGGGLALELKSGSTYSGAKAARTNEERHELTDRANRERRLGIAAASAGAVAVGAGVYLWLSSKPRKPQRRSVTLTPEVAAGRAGINLAAWF